MKAIFHSAHGETDFVDIVARGYISTISIHNLPTLYIYLLKYARSRQYLVETIINTDYVDDLVLLANRSAQTKSLLYSLEQTARNIGLLCKTVFMYFKQDGAISSLNDTSKISNPVHIPR